MTRDSWNTWQNLGLAAFTASTLAGVVWLLTSWPPAPPVFNAVRFQPQVSRPAPAPAPQPASLGPARHLLASGEPVTISVLGDSTGNDSNEWVSLWAQHLGQQHEVRLHALDPDTLRYGATQTYGSGGSPVTIWNGSVAGTTADYPITRLHRLQPRRPDLVIYSYGHNNTADTIAPQMDALAQMVTDRTRARQVVILQNPGLDFHAAQQEQTLAELRDWALAKHIPTVDVHRVFERQPKLRPLMVDEYHPNEAGSRLWARAVERALG